MQSTNVWHAVLKIAGSVPMVVGVACVFGMSGQARPESGRGE